MLHDYVYVRRLVENLHFPIFVKEKRLMNSHKMILYLKYIHLKLSEHKRKARNFQLDFT